MKKSWTSRELSDLFNGCYEDAKKVMAPLREQGLVNYELTVDLKTNEPVLDLNFQEGCTPDLSALPERIADFKVRAQLSGLASMVVPFGKR